MQKVTQILISLSSKLRKLLQLNPTALLEHFVTNKTDPETIGRILSHLSILKQKDPTKSMHRIKLNRSKSKDSINFYSQIASLDQSYAQECQYYEKREGAFKQNLRKRQDQLIQNMSTEEMKLFYN